MPSAVLSPDLVLAQLDNLPTLPAAAARVLELTSNPDVQLDEVVRVLRGDLAISARILSAVSAAPNGVREQITSLERAVPMLGLRTVRNLVLAAALFERFGPKTGESSAQAGFDRAEFWKHSIAVACAAQRLAAGSNACGVNPEDAYLAGLLHDLGKVALDAVFPKAFARAAIMAEQSRGDLADCERDVLGVDHTVAGRRLAERWRLPQALCDVIWLHHLAPDVIPTTVKHPRLVAVVQVADTLAREHSVGHSGNFVFYDHSPGLAARVGLSERDLDAASAQLALDVAEQARILGLDDPQGPGDCTAILQRANAELARANAELADQNRRLTIENRYLSAAATFDRALTDWTEPGAVTSAATLALRSALPSPLIAVWHIRRGRTALDLAILRPGDAHPRTSVQRPVAEFERWLKTESATPAGALSRAAPPLRALLREGAADAEEGVLTMPFESPANGTGGILLAANPAEQARLVDEQSALRSLVAVVAAALARADEQTAAQRLSEDLAESNRRLQQTQTELLRSRSLAMIAEMAAGAGHELNGPLAVISGRAQMLTRSSDDPETHRALKTISDKAHECSGIVTELMDFARPQPTQLEPVDLGELIDEAREQWLRDSGLPPSAVRAEKRAAGTLPPVVRGDRSQLHIVLRELLSNATDAIAPEGGLIALALSVRDDDTVELSVRDNGCGMAPNVLQRAFDPFFSHRRAGRRRGLGLPRVFRIVEAHGGRIWLESRPDEGTTARVRLPRQR